jgi:lysine-specific demethylase 8
VDAADLSPASFREKYLSKGLPVIITGATTHWPALGGATTDDATQGGSTQQGWADFAGLAARAGERLVPVEVYDAADSTQTYLTESWERRVMSLGDYIAEYVLADGSGPAGKRGYLAQYGLFDQIPSLRDDFTVPPFCSELLEQDRAVAGAAGAEDDASGGGVDDLCADANGVRTSAWLGPRGTVSPLHYDPYHNLLTQAVGSKYIRLFSPEVSSQLYPRAGAQCNNSFIDLDNLDHHKHPQFQGTASSHCVLAPGEMLHIPRHWWHYVRSLSPSFSISFWWGARL